MLFLISLMKCELFRIKLADEGKYLQKKITEKDTVFLGEYKNSEIYEINYNQDKPQLKWLNPQKTSEKTLGYDKNKNEIINVDLQKDKNNFLFQFIPIDLHKKTFWLVYNEKCATYKPNESNLILEPCYDYTKEQLFQFELTKNISDKRSARDDILSSMKKPGSNSLLEKSAKVRELENLIELNKSNLLSAYKGIYDLALCLGNNGYCTNAENHTTSESNIIIKNISN